VPEAEAATRAWRGIEELAELVGAYCWVEKRIFEISGAWASGVTTGADSEDALDPALRVWSAAVSRRHGLLAARWAERLPARAGVDAAALVAPPAGPLAGALEQLGARPDVPAGVAALVEVVLPGLQEVYAAHEQAASPVSEAPVLEVLAAARRAAAGEIGGGRLLLEGGPEGVTRDAALGSGLERALAETRVFPAVRAS
jgi:hypothetical protein